MNSENKLIVTNFIKEIWNNRQFEKIDDYLSANFIDHSLPPTLPPNKEGTKLWVLETGKSFAHQTIIDEIVCEGNKVILKIRMQLKHVGIWRNIQPTYSEISAVAYRYFKLLDGKIIGHWALLDGNSIENQLMETSKGCKIQE